MRSSQLLILFAVIFFAALLPRYATAQLSRSYFSADQLLKQQKYEEAAKEFEKLYNNQPGHYLYLKKLTECYINLKQYDKAIAVTEQAIEKGHLQSQAKIRLAELHHISGEKEKANEIWSQILQQNRGNQQVYLHIARVMKERKVFNRSIEIYKTLQAQAGNSNLITSELAETYMQAGKYESAIKEFLHLVRENPDRISYVQRRLMRFRDDYIYDIAILEIDDFLNELSYDHPSYHNLQQLEIWLLMERNLFKRALATAKNYEAQSASFTYILFSLGSKLLAAREFELAAQAYQFYIDNNVTPLVYRSREELAEVYIQWAKHLEDYNLDLSSKRTSLYQQAFEILNTLRNEVPNYRRLENVLITLSELSLDVLHEPDKASQYLDALRQISDDSLSIARQAYIEGRLHLYNEDYTRARLAFSKSNKQERIGNLAEKTRYYLALTDFFSGDYEFAKIQLNALERQSTSYYANDAVQLRLWIQNGLKADSSGANIKPFAKTIEHFSRGEHEKGIAIIKTLFSKDRYNPLLGHALLEINNVKQIETVRFIFQAITAFLKQQGSTSPLQEHLLWEKARLADQIVTNDSIAFFEHSPSNQRQHDFENLQIEIPKTVDQLIPLYEELLLTFPNGFYATYARERLQELENTQA